MNIGIDAKLLVKERAGIARNLLCIIERLQVIDRENRYFLFERRRSSYNPTSKNWEKVLVPSALPGSIWLNFRLPSYLKKYSIDVFWGPENIIPIFFVPKKTRLILTVCDLTFIHFPGTLQLWNYWVSKIFFYRALCKARRIISISVFTKKDIERTYSNRDFGLKTTAVYCGRPEWKLPAGYSDSNRKEYLLFVGSVEPRKNLIRLLAALDIVRKRGKNVSLRLIGPAGWKNRGIKNFINRHNLGGQIVFCGYVTEQQLIAEYVDCKAVVLPSIFEGFGLPVLEALQTDTVVLTSRGTVMEEIGGSGVILFDPFDPRDIADKIMMVYSEGFDRSVYLQNREDILKRFSWERAAEEHLRIFKEAD